MFANTPEDTLDAAQDILDAAIERAVDEITACLTNAAGAWTLEQQDYWTRQFRPVVERVIGLLVHADRVPAMGLLTAALAEAREVAAGRDLDDAPGPAIPAAAS